MNKNATFMAEYGKGKSKVLGEKPVGVTLQPPEIPQTLAWE